MRFGEVRENKGCLIRIPKGSKLLPKDSKVPKGILSRDIFKNLLKDVKK